jgi:hypothetical protein
VIPPEDQPRLLEAAAFMDANECSTLIAAARGTTGNSTEEVLAQLDAAALAFGAGTKKHFSKAGEF